MDAVIDEAFAVAARRGRRAAVAERRRVPRRVLRPPGAGDVRSSLVDAAGSRARPPHGDRRHQRRRLASRRGARYQDARQRNPHAPHPCGRSPAAHDLLTVPRHRRSRASFKAILAKSVARAKVPPNERPTPPFCLLPFAFCLLPCCANDTRHKSVLEAIYAHAAPFPRSAAASSSNATADRSRARDERAEPEARRASRAVPARRDDRLHDGPGSGAGAGRPRPRPADHPRHLSLASAARGVLQRRGQEARRRCGTSRAIRTRRRSSSR